MEMANITTKNVFALLCALAVLVAFAPPVAAATFWPDVTVGIYETGGYDVPVGDDETSFDFELVKVIQPVKWWDSPRVIVDDGPLYEEVVNTFSLTQDETFTFEGNVARGCRDWTYPYKGEDWWIENPVEESPGVWYKDFWYYCVRVVALPEAYVAETESFTLQGTSIRDLLFRFQQVVTPGPGGDPEVPVVPEEKSSGSSIQYRPPPTIDRDGTFTQIDGDVFPGMTDVTFRITTPAEINDFFVVYDAGGEMNFEGCTCQDIDDCPIYMTNTRETSRVHWGANGGNVITVTPSDKIRVEINKRYENDQPITLQIYAEGTILIYETTFDGTFKKAVQQFELEQGKTINMRHAWLAAHS
jgi:hypothetical protein